MVFFSLSFFYLLSSLCDTELEVFQYLEWWWIWQNFYTFLKYFGLMHWTHLVSFEVLLFRLCRPFWRDFCILFLLAYVYFGATDSWYDLGYTVKRKSFLLFFSLWCSVLCFFFVHIICECLFFLHSPELIRFSCDKFASIVNFLREVKVKWNDFCDVCGCVSIVFFFFLSCNTRNELANYIVGRAMISGFIDLSVQITFSSG